MSSLLRRTFLLLCYHVLLFLHVRGSLRLEKTSAHATASASAASLAAASASSADPREVTTQPAQALAGPAFMPPPDAAYRAKQGAVQQNLLGDVRASGSIAYPDDASDAMLPPGEHASGRRHGFPGVSGLPEHYQVRDGCKLMSEQLVGSRCTTWPPRSCASRSSTAVCVALVVIVGRRPPTATAPPRSRKCHTPLPSLLPIRSLLPLPCPSSPVTTLLPVRAPP